LLEYSDKYLQNRGWEALILAGAERLP